MVGPKFNSLFVSKLNSQNFNRRFQMSEDYPRSACYLRLDMIDMLGMKKTYIIVYVHIMPMCVNTYLNKSIQ